MVERWRDLVEAVAGAGIPEELEEDWENDWAELERAEASEYAEAERSESSDAGGTAHSGADSERFDGSGDRRPPRSVREYREEPHKALEGEAWSEEPGSLSVPSLRTWLVSNPITDRIERPWPGISAKEREVIERRTGHSLEESYEGLLNLISSAVDRMYREDT